MSDLTLFNIIGLALVDAINPCALAVMAIVLMTILLQHTEKRKAALLGGLNFILAVFIVYFIYGILFTQLFSHLIPETGNYAYYIFRGFGVFAIILGVLNLKDFLYYKPGGVMTEMPLKLRPKMKKLVSKITSPRGAFVIGIFVTLFLLPCTIGPYIIASGQLSALRLVSRIPWLIMYNLIFIIPMIGITLGIYLGLSTVDKVSGWKEQNIKYLHLIEAIILIVLGIAIVTGLI